MATYRIKRYSSEDESHVGRNLILGSAAIASGIMAGKAGYLGTGLLKSINSGWAKAGNIFNSNSMIRSGVNGQAKAMAKEANQGWWNELTSRLKHKVFLDLRKSILKGNTSYEKAWHNKS